MNHPGSRHQSHFENSGNLEHEKTSSEFEVELAGGSVGDSNSQQPGLVGITRSAASWLRHIPPTCVRIRWR